MTVLSLSLDFPGGSEVKASVCNAVDLGSIPGSGRCPGEGNGNSLQYSCLGNPWTEEPGGVQSMGSQKSRTDLVTKTSPWLNDCKISVVSCKFSQSQLLFR